MAAPINNWVHDQKIGGTELSKRTLLKAKQIEDKRIKEGWRWIELNPRTRIFVPCDKKGQPTKDGQRRINEMLARL